MNKPKSIHFVGIKGVGMTPLAIIAKEAGIMVTGSDVSETFITDVPLERAGIQPFPGFSPEHVGNVDLVITTGAHGGYDNPEVIAAKERDIPVLTKGEAVGSYMNGAMLGTSYKGIAIAGSHGKTTTAAMLATIFMKLQQDPSYLIGTSEIPSLSGMPGHFGEGAYFIAEADEYATEPTYDKTPQFFHQNPALIVITNIEHDHPDIYPTVTDVTNAFITFANRLPENGLVILCGDGNEAKAFMKQYAGNTVTYGISPENDYVLTDFRFTDGKMSFEVQSHENKIGTVTLFVPGQHNGLNAVAALLAAKASGISVGEAKQALQFFTGTKRRLEYKGKLESGAILYDDYAHHPTEITSTLQALKNLYPEKNILCIFQPHTYSRTKELLTEFASSLTHADTVILLPIFASSREAPDESVSSESLASLLREQHHDTFLLEKNEDVVEYIDQNGFTSETVIVTMGAGDVYKISEGLRVTDHNDEYRGQKSEVVKTPRE